MKRLLASFGWILLLFPVISLAEIRTALAAMAPQDSETRSVQPFRTVSSSGSFQVYIRLGDKENVRLEGDKEDLSQIETVVENGTLKLKYKNSSRWNQHQGKVNIYITAKHLEGITLSGSGDVKVDGIIKAQELKVRSSGSGNINFKTDNSRLVVAVSGSGDVSAAGTAQNLDIALSGSCDFKGENLHTEMANIKISGSGDVRINASKTINAAISGSGDVHYSGNPVVNSKTSGSGRVSKI